MHILNHIPFVDINGQSFCPFPIRISRSLQIAVRKYLNIMSGTKSNRLHTVFKSRTIVLGLSSRQAHSNDAFAGRESTFEKI